MSEPAPMSRLCAVAGVVLAFAFVGLFFFLPAGDLLWPRGWLFIAVNVAAFAVSIFWLRRVNPPIFAARSRVQPGTKAWDRILIAILLGTAALVFPVAALDDCRFHWSALSWPWLGLGYLLYLDGFSVTAWAMGENRFFEPGMRIQTERGHHVVDTGPYAVVRHPGYIAAIEIFLGMALALGSLWALLPAGLASALLVLRTAWEDATLQRELPGYREFATRTRYRLIPGIW